MTYEIIADPHTSELLIRDTGAPNNALYLPDLRGLLLLRTKLNHYIDTLQPDHTTPVQDELPQQLIDSENPVISAIDARNLAETMGIDLHPSTLRMAFTRGNIPTAHKRGGRWYVSRKPFLEWLHTTR